MGKFTINGLISLALLGALYGVYDLGGDHKEASLTATQATADKNEAVRAIEDWNTVTQALMNDVSKINKADDGSRTGAAIREWLSTPLPTGKSGTVATAP